MAKEKSTNTQKHLRARIAYLHEAAKYLTERSDAQDGRHVEASDFVPEGELKVSGLPNYLTSHLTQIARKSQMRLHTWMKHSVCRRCGTVLVDGKTCRIGIENLSKGGKKPHADMLLHECTSCGATKRFPVGARRQNKKKGIRTKMPKAITD